MKGRSVIFWVLLTACTRVGLNRAETRGPHAESVSASDVPVRGAHVEVEWLCPQPDDSSCSTEGELIAVDEKFVHLAESPDSPKLTPIPRAHVVAVTVEVADSKSGTVGVWTAVGCASTLSHGFFLVFTGPMWFVAGVSSALDESTRAHAKAGEHDMKELYQFARFPQGLPQTGPAPSAPAPAPRPSSLPPPSASASAAPSTPAPELPGSTTPELPQSPTP